MPVKLTKIKRLCLDTKRCELTTASDGSQWIGDGRHYFRLVGIDVERDALDELLGLNDKQVDKMTHLTTDRREPFFRREGQIIAQPLELRGVAIGYVVNVWVLEGPEGAVYVEEAAIEATRAADRTVDFRLVHAEDGQPLVAVLCGLFCDALLKPAVPEAAEEIRKSLEDMADIKVMDLPSPLGASNARETVRRTVSSEMGPAGPWDGVSPYGLTEEVEDDERERGAM